MSECRLQYSSVCCAMMFLHEYISLYGVLLKRRPIHTYLYNKMFKDTQNNLGETVPRNFHRFENVSYHSPKSHKLINSGENLRQQSKKVQRSAQRICVQVSPTEQAQNLIRSLNSALSLTIHSAVTSTE